MPYLSVRFRPAPVFASIPASGDKSVFLFPYGLLFLPLSLRGFLCGIEVEGTGEGVADVLAPRDVRAGLVV